MDHTSCCICKTVSFRELSNAIFNNDIKEILNFTFFQLYNYIVVITEKYNGDLLGGIHKVRTQLEIGDFTAYVLFGCPLTRNFL